MLRSVTFLTVFSGFLAGSLAVASSISALEPRQQSQGRHFCDVIDSPTSGQHVCNFTGILVKPSAPLTSQSPSFEECRDGCLTSKSRPCRSFSYDTNSTICQTWNVTLEHQQPEASDETEVVYWDRKCFKARYSKNLAVRNGGFEKGSLPPWISTTAPNQTFTGVVQTNAGNGYGNRAAFLAAFNTQTTGDRIIATIDQKLFLCLGNSYTITFSLYQVPGGTVTNGSDLPFMGALLSRPDTLKVVAITFPLETNDFILPNQTTVPAGQWKDFSFNFFASQSGKWNLEIEVQAPPSTQARVRADKIQIALNNPS